MPPSQLIPGGRGHTAALLLIACLSLLVAFAAATDSARDTCCTADCSDGDLRLCARADVVAKRCQPAAADAAWCRCCQACPARVGSLAASRRRRHAKRCLRKQLRRLVRRLGAMPRPRSVGGGAAAAKPARNADSAAADDSSNKRGRLMEQLLELELHLLNLSRGSGRRLLRWTNGSLEEQYFVDEPAAAASSAMATPTPTTMPTTAPPFWAADASEGLAWLNHLEEQRTSKVKDACQRVSCKRSKGELCLTNIQDLPVCRCVTNVNCINERRRLKFLGRMRRRSSAEDARRSRRRRHRRRDRRRDRSRRRRIGRKQDSGRQLGTTPAPAALRWQFSGRVCAHLSGFPTERTYQSVCHMHAAMCASDSQILRLTGGTCANHDPESEALERLTYQKCARCDARGWRSRGCRRWRKKCHLTSVA